MKDSNRIKCKVDKCKHPATKQSGFCGWCEKKYVRGILLADGRLANKVCKSKLCDRPAKSDGWCGWCIRKFEKGELLHNGSPSIAAERQAVNKKRRQAKREKSKKDRELKQLKEDIRDTITLAELTHLKSEQPEWGKAFGCPILNERVDVLVCLNRMLIMNKTRKGKIGMCQKCTYHDDKLILLKSSLGKDMGLKMDST